MTLNSLQPLPAGLQQVTRRRQYCLRPNENKTPCTHTALLDFLLIKYMMLSFIEIIHRPVFFHTLRDE